MLGGPGVRNSEGGSKNTGLSTCSGTGCMQDLHRFNVGLQWFGPLNRGLMKLMVNKSFTNT